MESDYLMEQKVKLLVEMQTKQFVSLTKELQSKITALEHEVDTLKTNIKGVAEQASSQVAPAIQQALPSEPVQLQQVPVAQQAQQTLPTSGPQHMQPSTPSPQPTPVQTVVQAKTGEVTPEEVSVEKMFYFGNK